jgi:hypothetical protein
MRILRMVAVEAMYCIKFDRRCLLYQKNYFEFHRLVQQLGRLSWLIPSTCNENGFAWAFGGDSGTCVCRGKVTSRLSPCFAGELRILLSSIFGKKNPLGFPIFGQLVRLFLRQLFGARGVCFKEQMSTEQLSMNNWSNCRTTVNGTIVYRTIVQQNNCLQNNCHRFSIT